MSAGGDRASHGLRVDVTHGVQGEPEVVQQRVEHPEGGAAQCGDGHRLAVDRADPDQPVRPKLQPVADGDVGERVAAPDHLHPQPVDPRRDDRLGHLGGIYR